MELTSVVDRCRIAHLEEIIAELGSVVVAFSGGADSTLLLAMCLRVLGTDKVLAVTADSPTLPRSELNDAIALASELGARHTIVETDELGDERFSSNPQDRCFYCKQELFVQLRDLAARSEYEHLTYGATAADVGDHRPGMRAATEAGAAAPLLDAGFTKQHVRELSREMGLRTWDKPAMACLSSRFPYGTRITDANLSRVERAEEYLRGELGISQVRVRHHGSVARIEVGGDDLAALAQRPIRERVARRLKEIGYTYVTLDLEGFRSGSMNETLDFPADDLVVAASVSREGQALSR
jgi:pyridinium-3,5-biscarboxylic acid mononucleotide sulfurtransferase